MIEWLESRMVLSNYTVTSTAYSPTTDGTLAYEIGTAITAGDQRRGDRLRFVARRSDDRA